MSWLTRLRRLFAPQETLSRTPPSVSRRARASVDRADEPIHAFGLTIEAPTEPDLSWRTLNLDSKTLSRITPARLLELLADLSPDVSKALWDFLRLTNPGYKIDVLESGGKEQDEMAQALLDAFVDELHDLYGSFDVVVGRLFISAFLRGALFAEIVLDGAGVTPIDLATPDPYTARFKKRTDPDRGIVWDLGQWQEGEFVDLALDTIRYVPIDPFPGKPYGRALVQPALFSTLFLLGLMHDLRRVVAQQGYPRIDIAVKLQELADATPDDILSDVKKWQAWVNEIIDEVEDVYADLEPDDAYIHADVIEVNRPVGTVNADALGAIDGLIEALERMSTRALKSMPILMGLRQSNTETQAIREWEIFSAGIKSLQHLAENMFERLLGVALEAQGIQADVKFRFAELRAAEAERDARVKKMEQENALFAYLAGWLSQEEASMAGIGQLPDSDAPRVALQPPSISNALDAPELTLREVRRDVARALNGKEA